MSVPTDLQQRIQGVYVYVNGNTKSSIASLDASAGPTSVIAPFTQVAQQCSKGRQQIDVLFYKCWQPLGPVRASLTFLHGLGEHCERYDPLFNYFKARGIRVHAFDWRGHGKSWLIVNELYNVIDISKATLGVQGHLGKDRFVSMDDVVEQVKTIVSLEWDSSLPKIIMGHSMGGILTLAYVLETRNSDRFVGVISSAPAFDVGTPLPIIKYYGGKLVSKILPTVTLDNGLDLAGLTRDPQQLDMYKNDPFVHPNITAGTAVLIIAQGERFRDKKNASSISQVFQFPVLFAHGDKDRLTSYPATRKFTEQLKKTNSKVSFNSYEEFYHECTINEWNDIDSLVHNEPAEDRKRVFDDYGSWLDSILQ